MFVYWQSGNSHSKVSVKRNGTGVVNTGAWQGDPGYDIWMTYNHMAKTVVFEIDNWNGGRFSGINITTDPVSVDGFLTDTDKMHIFFGANAKVTWADFDVTELTDLPPITPVNVYSVVSNMAVDVKWDLVGGADGYEVKRSSVSGSGYATIGTTTNSAYVDTTVETNENYYYVVAATNEFGVSDDSAEVTGVGLPYDIISDHVSTYGAGSALDNDNLFDNDISTYYDTTSPNGGWVGLDFGTNNAQQIMVVEYVLRDWYLSVARGTNAVFEGANNADFSDAVLLHTVPGTVAAYPSINTATITETTPFRYVRLKAPSDRPLYAFAEVKFYTAEDLTANGTPTEWLDGYYMIPGTNNGVWLPDYAAADVSDTDGDGLLAWQEYKLGSDPTDANSPAGVENLYAWPEAALENVVRWDASSLAEGDAGSGYIVYRSEDGSVYTAIGSSATTEYTDPNVTDGVTYYYKASVTNATFQYESALSASEMATANQYDIIGVMNNSGAQKTRWFYELFDRNLDTFMDDYTYDGYGGLDYGDGNAQQIVAVAYRPRNDSWAYDDSGHTVDVDGVPVSVNRAQYFVYGNTFEGSNDGTTWTVLATITNAVPKMAEWNTVEVTDASAYRYVRYYPASGLQNIGMGDVEFMKPSDFTAKGTPHLWLEENGLTAGDDELDGDSDGHEAWEEYVAGTDPNDADSVLEITSGIMTNSDLILSWQSVEGKTYSIVTNANLTLPNPGPVASGIPSQGTNTSYSIPMSGEATLFYEIGVQ